MIRWVYMARDIQELLTRGVEEVIDAKNLEKKLSSGKKLRIKLGIDPTSPDIHIGHAVSILKLKDFQDLGHQVVLIVGDFTAVIGDTSDKDSERPMLDKETVELNKKSYFDQVGKIIDLNKAELRYNSEWLEGLTYREVGEHASLFSVADFISRDNIKRRLETGKRVSLREVLYPLMQGYDSVVVEADVELGGMDQKFNLLSGRTLQNHFKQEPQNLIMTPLIPGLDGRKMSKSYGNGVFLGDSPSDMYGKLMSLSDEHIETYFKCCTRVPLKEVEEIVSGHPKEAKMRLAFEITKIYHGEVEAQKSQKDFEEAFSKGGAPEDIKTVEVSKETPLIEVLLKEGLVSSKTEYNRLEKAGAIKELESGVYKIGKHRFIKIVYK